LIWVKNNFLGAKIARQGLPHENYIFLFELFYKVGQKKGRTKLELSRSNKSASFITCWHSFQFLLLFFTLLLIVRCLIVCGIIFLHFF